MKIAISIGISPRESFQAWEDLVTRLDGSGVDCIWLIDSQLAMKDVYIGLALAARRTNRVQLGTGVTNPLTRHPTVTATSIAAISELSNGRALLGIGAGDSAVYGVGWKPAGVAVMEASLRFFRAVLNGREGEWDGKRFHLPHLAAPVKIYLAVSQPKMCRLAGRFADGAIVMGPAQADSVRQQVEWIEEGIAAEGRARADVDIGLVTTVSAQEDGARAVDDVRSWATAQARLLATVPELPPSLQPFRAEIARAKESYDYSEHLSTHAGHRDAISDELTQRLAVAGTPDECGQHLRDLRATGIDGFILPLLGGGRMERLRVLQEAVLPKALA